jgi:sulfopyruvate decarboxylase TPP-binding subunit
MMSLPFSDLVMVPCSILTTLSLPERIQQTILATREDEAIAIAAGMAVAGRNPLVAMQNSGFANALNTVGSLAVAYRIGLAVLVSVRGYPTDANPTQILIGHATKALIQGLGLSWDEARTQGEIAPALSRAAAQAVSGVTSVVLYTKAGRC